MAFDDPGTYPLGLGLNETIGSNSMGDDRMMKQATRVERQEATDDRMMQYEATTRETE